MSTSKALAIILIIGFFACEALAARSNSLPPKRNSKSITVHARNLAQKGLPTIRGEMNLLAKKNGGKGKDKANVRKGKRNNKKSHRSHLSSSQSSRSHKTEYITEYTTVEEDSITSRRKGWESASGSIEVRRSNNTINLSDSSNFRERIIETTTVTEITVKSFITEHKERIRRIISGQTAFEATATLKSKDLGNESYSEKSNRAARSSQESRHYPESSTRVVWKKPHKVAVTVSNSTGLYVVSGSSSHPEVLRLTDSDLSWSHKEFVVSSIPTWLEKTGKVSSRRRSVGFTSSRYNDLLGDYLFD